MTQRKTAVITGSTSGIGLGIAKAFAATGTNIVLNGIESPEEVQPLVDQLKSEHDIEAMYCNANLMQADGVNSLIDVAVKTFGSVDILVAGFGAYHARV